MDRYIFISYNSKDREAARSFCECADRYGLRVWFDERDLLPGANFTEEIEGAIKAASAAAVLVGPTGYGPWETFEMQTALQLAASKKLRVIPVLLPGAREQPELPIFLRMFTWLDLRQGIDQKHIEAIKRALSSSWDKATLTNDGSGSPATLTDVLRHARKRIVISGHTLDKLINEPGFGPTLIELLGNGVTVSIIQLNPYSHYAQAHQPYHEFESSSATEQQHGAALRFFDGLFEQLNPPARDHLEILFSNYMPRFRSLIVDETVYIYLYMYGCDVDTEADIVLEPLADASDALRRKVFSSTMKLINAAEIVPYIRRGQRFSFWNKTKLARWDNWKPEERKRQRLTHDFYVTYAEGFYGRFGHLLEREVRAHLDYLGGRILVLGCGSGKEVEYLARIPSNDVLGMDFSYVAIDLAKQEHPDLSQQFIIGDFYDLDLFFDDQFDSIVANASFVHLYSRSHIDELLAMVWRRLVNGGQFLLRGLYKEKDGLPLEDEIDDSEGHLAEWKTRRWFVYFSRAELADRCTKAGFEVLDAVTKGIAEKEYGSDEGVLSDVHLKGFRHIQYRGVYWPILLLRKPVA